MKNPFPEVIKTRIAGRKVTRFVRNGFVMLRVVREEYPSVIWVSWIRKISERRLPKEIAAQGEKFMKDQS